MWLKRYRDVFLVVLLLAVPFFFLRASVRRPEELDSVDRALLRVAAPIQYASGALARGISNLVADYVYLVDVKRNNDRLAYENSRLAQRVRDLSAAEAENRRLRKLLGLRDTVPDELVSGVVTTKETTEWFRVAHIALDAPTATLRPRLPVVSAEGVVGTILRISGDSVDVQLAVDAGFGVDVVVERTGARGFVRGTGDRARYAVRVEFMRREDEVAEGDILLTSGVGCRFPKGLPVAVVRKVEKKDFGLYQTVEAAPAVDFSRLEEVVIVLTDEQSCGQGGGRPSAAPRR
ncbi:MAG: rod shape-determining protein MreC [Polyangiaceae bacterium]|nr:rod shape-determining protein MreC [Polyangiaceae bacterium]